VVHNCTPSYSGGSRFKASPGKWFERTYLEKAQHKNGWWNGLRCRPWV
jgi:hypothetical protein